MTEENKIINNDVEVNYDSSSEVSKEIQAEKEGVSNETSDQISDTQKNDNDNKQPDMNNVIAGVKKEFKEKGYKQGYEQAKAEMSQMLNNQANKQNQQAPQQTYDPNQPLTIAQWQSIQFQQKADKIYHQGKQKYPDYEEKIGEVLQNAQYNPTLKSLLQQVVQTENADLAYKIASNENYRGRLLGMNPQNWGGEFFSSSNNNNKDEIKKTPPEPIEPIKVAPAAGKKDRKAARIEFLRNNGFIQ